jgi:hypothetical protein
MATFFCKNLSPYLCPKSQHMTRKISLGIIISLLLSQFFIFVSSSPSDILQDGSYWMDSVIFGGFTFLLLAYCYAIFIHFLNPIDFETQFNKRVALQFLLGLLLPSMVIWLFSYTYLSVFLGQSASEISFNYIEFPVSIIVLLLLNIFFVGYFYFNENKKTSVFFIPYNMKCIKSKD